MVQLVIYLYIHGGWWPKKSPHDSKQISAVIGVLMGGQPLGKQFFDGIPCRLCGKREIAESVHVILTCEALQAVRADCLDRVKRVMPHPM